MPSAFLSPEVVSTIIVIGWFLLPQLVGWRFGWRGVAIATAIYGIIVPALSYLIVSNLFLAGSLTLLPLMVLFVIGLNVALFALLKTVGELFGRGPKPRDTTP